LPTQSMHTKFCLQPNLLCYDTSSSIILSSYLHDFTSFYLLHANDHAHKDGYIYILFLGCHIRQKFLGGLAQAND